MPATSMLYFMVHTKKILFTGKRMSAASMVVPLVALSRSTPKDYCLPCLLLCSLVPVLVRHGGHSVLHLLHFVYTRLLALVSINSLTGSVLKNCSTTTSIGTSFPCWRDCFMDVNAGHSLHKCHAVSTSSSRQP